MVGTGLLAGERVRRAATGEDGVVLSVGDGMLVQVALDVGGIKQSKALSHNRIIGLIHEREI